MRWKQRDNYVRPARPKARSMKAEETGQILARLNGAVEHSPVLRALGVQARHLRGRFYLDWRWEPVERPEEVSTYGRLTPLAQVAGKLLLEVPYGQGQWSKKLTGSPEKLIEFVAGDKNGTFHGMGALDES